VEDEDKDDVPQAVMNGLTKSKLRPPPKAEKKDDARRKLK
jgi:hypothetical protein